MTDLNVRDFGAKGDGQTDDAPAIQRTLHAARDAGGGTVYVPGGNYAVRSILRIASQTTLKMEKNAYIQRQGATNAIFVNDSNGKGGYEGSKGIIIYGGTLDGNMKLNDLQCTVVAIGHAQDVKIRDVTILNVRDWHAIELNGVDGAEITGCTFRGFTLTRPYSEAIQLDLMRSTGTFPWFGPYDHTYCRNIIISGCTFAGNWYRGIGSHSATEGVYHSYIRMVNNHFEGLPGEGIEAFRYRHSVIAGNTFSRVKCGVRLKSSAYCSIYGNTIRYPAEEGIVLDHSDYNTVTGNVIRGAGRTGVLVGIGSDGNQVGFNF